MLPNTGVAPVVAGPLPNMNRFLACVPELVDAAVVEVGFRVVGLLLPKVKVNFGAFNTGAVLDDPVVDSLVV